MLRLSLAFLIVAGLTGFAPAPLPKPPKLTDAEKVLKQLQGTYEMVRVGQAQLGIVNGGVQNIAVARSTTKIKIDGNKWSYLRSLRGAEDRVTTTYEMKIEVKDKQVFLTLSRPGVSSVVMKGNLFLEGEAMKFVYSSGSTNTSIRIVNNVKQVVQTQSPSMEMLLKKVTP